MRAELVLSELAPQISSAISDVHHVFVGRDYIRFDFSDSEFSVRLCDDDLRLKCIAKFTAVVRATMPDARTWWTAWSLSCHPDALGTTIANEVTSRRGDYRRMVAENVIRKI